MFLSEHKNKMKKLQKIDKNLFYFEAHMIRWGSLKRSGDYIYPIVYQSEGVERYHIMVTCMSSPI